MDEDGDLIITIAQTQAYARGSPAISRQSTPPHPVAAAAADTRAAPLFAKTCGGSDMRHTSQVTAVSL